MCYGAADFAPFDGENTRPLAEIQDEIALKTLKFVQRAINEYNE